MLNLSKKDTQVSKNGYDSSKFEFRILDESALKDVKGLQSEILDELGPDQTFITENTDADFKGYLSGEKGRILGVYDPKDRKLFGMIILKSLYTPDVFFDGVYDKKIHCLGGVLVHKDYRGHGVSKTLISKIIEMNPEISDYVAYVDAKNPQSYVQFLKSGFGIASAYRDPEFQSPSYALVLTQDAQFKKYLYYPSQVPEPKGKTFEQIQKILKIAHIRALVRKKIKETSGTRPAIYPVKKALLERI